MYKFSQLCDNPLLLLNKNFFHAKSQTSSMSDDVSVLVVDELRKNDNSLSRFTLYAWIWFCICCTMDSLEGLYLRRCSWIWFIVVVVLKDSMRMVPDRKWDGNGIRIWQVFHNVSYTWSSIKPYLLLYHIASIESCWAILSVHGSPTAIPTKWMVVSSWSCCCCWLLYSIISLASVGM